MRIHCFGIKLIVVTVFILTGMVHSEPLRRTVQRRKARDRTCSLATRDDMHNSHLFSSVQRCQEHFSGKGDCRRDVVTPRSRTILPQLPLHEQNTQERAVSATKRSHPQIGHSSPPSFSPLSNEQPPALPRASEVRGLPTGRGHHFCR